MSSTVVSKACVVCGQVSNRADWQDNPYPACDSHSDAQVKMAVAALTPPPDPLDPRNQADMPPAPVASVGPTQQAPIENPATPVEVPQQPTPPEPASPSSPAEPAVPTGAQVDSAKAAS